MVSQAEIQNLVNTLVEIEHPQKVVLFGSYARGTAHEDSDVDVLVIVKDATISRLKRMQAVRRQLGKYDFNFSKDILIYTTAEVEDWKNVSQAFITTAMKEGRIMYENKD